MSKKPKIILVSGKARAGKDTLATFFKEIAGYNNEKVWIINYADLVKYICSKYYDWNGVKDDYGRSLLQKIGTDVGRANNENVWVNCVIELVKALGGEYDYIVIPDVRFPNEIELWRETSYENYTVRIERYNEDETIFDNGLTAAQKQHSSETSLDDYKFDYNIINTSISYFLDRIERIYNQIKEKNNG